MDDLFDNPDIARARKSDPVTSHIAADALNADDSEILRNQQRIVLDLVFKHNGLNCKQLGRTLANIICNPESYEWPRKRMKELETKGFVTRRVDPGESQLRCYITQNGIDYLNR